MLELRRRDIVKTLKDLPGQLSTYLQKIDGVDKLQKQTDIFYLHTRNIFHGPLPPLRMQNRFGISPITIINPNGPKTKIPIDSLTISRQPRRG